MRAPAGRRQRRSSQQRLNGGDTVDAAPVENYWYGEIVGERDLRAVAALEMKMLIAKRPHRGRRLPVAQFKQVCLAAKRQRRRRFGARGLARRLQREAS